MLFVSEFPFLKIRVGLHTRRLIGLSQLEHGKIESVPTCQGNELVAVAHVRQFLPKLLERARRQVGLPVEGGRTVVGQQFAGEFSMNGSGKARRLH